MLNNREYRMFEIARQISYLSDFHGPHMGAVVAIGKNVISTGFNSNKTHPIQHQYNIYRGFENHATSIPLEHAEVHALSHLIGKKGIDWERASIYVYREWKDGKKACSRPCPACMRLIRDLGIKQIYFINEIGEYCKEKVL